MKILVDTSVWSLVLRRKNPDLQSIELFKSLSQTHELMVTGIIVQEVLSSIADKSVFDSIKAAIASMHCIEPEMEDYVFAAELSGRLKTKGVSSKTIDLLLASVAIRRNLAFLTQDKDFDHIAKVEKINVLKLRN